MSTLKTELVFHFNERNWNVSHYASEKFSLILENHNPEIFFTLSDRKSIYLSGEVCNQNNKIIFTFNKKSKWLKNIKSTDASVIELLEHLFLFMKLKGISHGH